MLVLPSVETVTYPSCGARQDHHTDLPPGLPAWLGSPGSFVALILFPVTTTFVPEINVAAANMSLVGAGCPGAGKTTPSITTTIKPLRKKADTEPVRPGLRNNSLHNGPRNEGIIDCPRASAI